jgi:hypothetical protein
VYARTKIDEEEHVEVSIARDPRAVGLNYAQGSRHFEPREVDDDTM